MLFTEPLFILFFAVVFGVHWALPGNRARKRWLFFASYVFYSAWDWRFLALIFASTLIDYVAALGMQRAGQGPGRRRWLHASLAGNLGMLGFFKYYDFFATSTSPVLEWLGFPGIRSLDLILPVGISFFTFQSLSYSIDVYRGKVEPVRNFPDFALFVSFFPQLVMGPILRASQFLPQLQPDRRFGDVRFKAMITLFLIGFVKKACISDNIAPLTDLVYANSEAHTAGAIAIASLFYTVQVYCDFSGYTDMAIAVAGLLGFRVARNFYFPLLARDITDFWRRWHISFGSWLRDYLYFPIGGSRGSNLATFRNLMFTMLVSGLWHGAGFTFIGWGAMSGLGLIVHRAYTRWQGAPAALRRAFGLLGWPLTYLWFAYTLIFFRATSIEQALEMSWTLLVWASDGARTLSPWLLLWFAPMALTHLIAYRIDPPRAVERVPDRAFALGLGILSALALSFVRLEYRPFIYFQF